MHLIFVIAFLANSFSIIPGHFEDSLSQALFRSHQEEKNLLLYFRSDDCTSCSKTDAFFESEDIRQSISEHFIAAWVNIKDFDGNACQEIYSVKTVPAIVVVSPTGSILFRSGYEFDQNRIREIILTPSQMDKPGIVFSDSAEPNQDENLSRNDPLQHVVAPGSYTVQAGFFSVYDNAANLRTTLETAGIKPVRIIQEDRNGKPYYRVAAGNFGSENQAKAYMKSVTAQGFNAKVFHTQ